MELFCSQCGTQRRRLDKETFFKNNDNEVLYLYTNTILKEETLCTFLIYIFPYNISRVSFFSTLERSILLSFSVIIQVPVFKFIPPGMTGTSNNFGSVAVFSFGNIPGEGLYRWNGQRLGD